MANAAKTKGDRGERAAVALLCALAPDLVCERPERMLGAGRRDDIGDLRVFDDVTIQVKTMKDFTRAMRVASDDAYEQNERAGLRHALGMVPIPHASTAPDAVKWIAACRQLPGMDHLDVEGLFCTGQSSLAVDWLRLRPTKKRPSVRQIDDRFAVVQTKGLPEMYLATIQSWLRLYRLEREPSIAGVGEISAR